MLWSRGQAGFAGLPHDGKVITDFRSTESESIEALIIDNIGRIVVAGSAWRPD